MTGKTEFVPGRGYTRKDWDAVESPDLTEEELAQAKPFAEALPELAAAIKRGRGRPTSPNPKETISIRLSPDVLAHFRATGPGWQKRVEEVLRKAAGL